MRRPPLAFWVVYLVIWLVVLGWVVAIGGPSGPNGWIWVVSMALSGLSGAFGLVSAWLDRKESRTQ